MDILLEKIRVLSILVMGVVLDGLTVGNRDTKMSIDSIPYANLESLIILLSRRFCSLAFLSPSSSYWSQGTNSHEPHQF